MDIKTTDGVQWHILAWCNKWVKVLERWIREKNPDAENQNYITFSPK